MAKDGKRLNTAQLRFGSRGSGLLEVTENPRFAGSTIHRFTLERNDHAPPDIESSSASIFRGVLHVVDDNDVYRALLRNQFEPDLLPQSL